MRRDLRPYFIRQILSGWVRFYTRRSLARVAERSGWRVRHIDPTGLPLEIVDRGADSAVGADAPTPRTGRRLVATIDRAGVALAPTLFGYQFLFELEPDG